LKENSSQFLNHLLIKKISKYNLSSFREKRDVNTRNPLRIPEPRQIWVWGSTFFPRLKWEGYEDTQTLWI
jgi:hypothetical protein